MEQTVCHRICCSGIRGQPGPGTDQTESARDFVELTGFGPWIPASVDHIKLTILLVRLLKIIETITILLKPD